MFKDINKSEPVKEVDLPDAPISKENREMLVSAVSALESQFKEFFKSSMKCRPPHLNADNLREALFHANVLERHDLRNDDELLAWMLEQNAELEKRKVMVALTLTWTLTRTMTQTMTKTTNLTPTTLALALGCGLGGVERRQLPVGDSGGQGQDVRVLPWSRGLVAWCRGGRPNKEMR
jgi:hypothetical protein